jgi:hypothetical protein
VLEGFKRGNQIEITAAFECAPGQLARERRSPTRQVIENSYKRVESEIAAPKARRFGTVFQTPTALDGSSAESYLRHQLVFFGDGLGWSV